MNAIEQGDRIIGLVGLKLANQMQFDPRMGCAQPGPLGLGFLHPVFPEDPLSRNDQRLDPVGIVGLADRDEGDFVGLAAGNPGGGGNPGADIFKQGGWLFHRAAL